MSRYEKLMSRIRGGGCVLMDGATGTEVERRGVKKKAGIWNGGGALTHPQIVRQIHTDYIRHGAEIIITNTFGTSRHAMKNAGMEKQFEYANRKSVALALEARQRCGSNDVLVAGGVSYWNWVGEDPSPPALHEGVMAQTRIMKEAGVDLIMLEMMVDIPRMLTTLDAALACGLPIWAGLTCHPEADGLMRLKHGETLAEALFGLKHRDVDLISVMHTEVDHIDDCLDILLGQWKGPVGVYAHTGTYKDSNWIFDNTISPADYADACGRWLRRGVQVVGGCCGIGVEHIAKINETITALKEKRSADTDGAAFCPKPDADGNTNAD